MNCEAADQLRKGDASARAQVTPSVFLATVIVIIVQVMVFSHMWPTVSIGKVDFRSFYQAGELVLHATALSHHLPGGKGSPITGEQTAPTRFPGPNGPDQLHPPFELLIFTPLAALPYGAAYVAWYCCNLLMLLGALLVLWNHAPALHNRFGLLLFGGTTAYPVLVSLSQGQDSILLLVLLTLGFVNLKKGHEFRAGVALGMGMFKFHLVGPIVLGLIVVTRKWRALAAFVMTCVALLLASFALIGAKAAIGYWFFIIGFGRITPPVAKLNHMPSLREFLHALAPRSIPAAWVDFVVIGLSTAILAFVLVRCAKARQAEMLDLRFSLLVTTAAAISYHFFVHNATILLLPVVLAADYFAGAERPARLRVPFLIAVATMYFAPFIIPEPVDMLVFFCGLIVLLLILYRSTSHHAFPHVSPLPASAVMPDRAASVAANGPSAY